MDSADEQSPPRRVALSLRIALIACLAALVVHLLWAHGNSPDNAAAAACTQGSPSVVRASAADLAELRESVATVMPAHRARLYEEGTIQAANAWSDDSPSPPPPSPAQPRPTGYEIRWWAPNHDDVVADVFVFAGPADARAFLRAALASRCRPAAEVSSTAQPAATSNLYWINPDGFAQEDAYMLRGSRVYRVAAVGPGSSRLPVASVDRRRAFGLVDHWACLLPEAGCSRGPVADPRGLSFARAVNLTAADFPGAIAPTTDEVTLPGERHAFDRCIGFAPAAVDLRSPLLGRGAGYAAEQVRSTIQVFASTQAANRGAPSSWSARVRGCVGHVLRNLILANSGKWARVGRIKLNWATESLAGGIRSMDLRIRSRLLSRGAKAPAITLYEDLREFVFGRARISLGTSSLRQPIAAKTEQQLLMLLLERAKSHGLYVRVSTAG